MTPTELISALRRLEVQTGSFACLGCGHEHNCGIHGCAIIREAADRISSSHSSYIALNDNFRCFLESIAAPGGVGHLLELYLAEKAGRVVALPVRPVLTQSIGSMLYIIEDGEIVEDSLCEALVGMGSNGEINTFYTTLSDQISFEQADIGKTVFLTREEAEKALEKMKDE